MKRSFLITGALALVAGLSIAASAAVGGNDCPGVMTCPITGKVICVERCPLTHPEAAPCPGTVVCPDTGKTICIERCQHTP